MKIVIQRVLQASVAIDGDLHGQIGKGYLLLIGISNEDTKEIADKMLEKIAKLRIFEDENGKTNLSIADVGGEVLAVSQFTLYADVSHGNRPGFTDAEVPDKASLVYDYFCEKLKEEGVVVKKGVFGADMKILQLSDGPVTIIYDL